MKDISRLGEVKDAIRDIPDFPKKGILFKDLTTVFKDPVLVNILMDAFLSYYSGKGITKVAGIESRGFILGSILAKELNAGFIPIRKPGKLPAATHAVKYELEYGTDMVEIHQDALNPGDVVLLHDDLLATGGTAAASMELIRKSGVKEVYASFIVELTFLKGKQMLSKDLDILSLIEF